MGDLCSASRSSRRDGGFGLVSIVVSLLIVALLSVGALKAFAGSASTGPGSPALNPTVDQAYDVQAQSALSSAMQNVRDGATSNGGLSDSDLAQYGVISGPSTSSSTVSGSVASTSATGDGLGGPLGFGGHPGGAGEVGNVLVRLVLELGHVVRLRARRHLVRGATDRHRTDARCGITGNDRLAGGVVPHHGVTTGTGSHR